MQLDFKNIGIGIDIVDVNRFMRKPFSSNQSFYEKIFTPKEIKYCLQFKNPAIHFAGKFAAKEAVIKAIPEPLSLKQVQILNSTKRLTTKILKKTIKKYHVEVSISHEEKTAIGIAFSQLVK